MSNRYVRVEIEDGIALVTLDRPQTYNSLNQDMMLELGRLWPQIERDKDVRVIVIAAEGKHFCSGGDLSSFAEATAEGRFFMDIDDPDFHGWTPRRYGGTKPVVAAVQGICCGGGLDFATEADIVVAAESAQFFDPHVSVGFVSSHESIHLAQKIPLGEVLMMSLMGNAYRMSAQRAYETGLAQRVVADDQLLDSALEIARAIAANAPMAVRGTREAIWRSLGNKVDDAIQIAASYLYLNLSSEDATEGPAAFAEGRKPVFTGASSKPFRPRMP